MLKNMFVMKKITKKDSFDKQFYVFTVKYN